MTHSRLPLVAFLCAAALLAAAPVHAQVRPAVPDSLRGQLPRLTPQQLQIIQRIRESGLSREQVRQRLRDAGYDPTLVDRYYDEMTRPDTSTSSARLSRITQPLPQPSGDLVQALRRVGILAVADTLLLPVEREDSVAPPRRRSVPAASAEPQIFGRETFAATTLFEPVASGPVDPDYRLGPGDQVTLIVTGDVEAAYDLQVTREGYVVVPDVGQVVVNGLTLEQFRRRLNERLARVYSGVQAGTTQVDLTIGRLRSKLVYVMGEVEIPGGHQLPGSATVFHALYRAGGPSENGSFRNIEVRRDNRVIRTVDLYSYLLEGDQGGDLRLEQGDVVFVPVVGSRVTVAGSVRRPAVFEVRPGEQLRDVMAFAGGAAADAAVERVQIDRILPPGQRQPGRERTLVDVPLERLLGGDAVALMNGDRVRVSTISDARRNRVGVTGDIQRPGEYEYRTGMTALELIDAAQGLLPTAYTPTAHVVRLNPVDSTTSIVRVTLDDPSSADYAGRVPLEDLDELVVFGRARLANPRRIELFGEVKNPGTYPYSDGMSIDDLILLAGGFTEGAVTDQAEVARRLHRGGITDTLASVFRVSLDIGNGGGQRTQRFALEQGDQVFIRRTPGYGPLSTVQIVGEVIYPGPYTVGSRQERVSHIIERAGGFTPEAYPRGFRLFRDGKPVGVNLARALARPGGPDDLTVEPGDRMEVPRLDPTVLVTGAVQFESRVRYEKGLSINEYIARAGGVRDDGNAARVSVRYPNGELRTPQRYVFVRDYPAVEPGSTITVPVRAEGTGFDWDRALARTMTVLSTLATVLLAVNAVK